MVCKVHEKTGGRVECFRGTYAHDLCEGHYKQARSGRPFKTLREHTDEKLKTLTVRVPASLHDELLRAATEEAVSPYVLHRNVLESWYLRRQAKKR